MCWNAIIPTNITQEHHFCGAHGTRRALPPSPPRTIITRARPPGARKACTAETCVRRPLSSARLPFVTLLHANPMRMCTCTARAAAYAAGARRSQCLCLERETSSYVQHTRRGVSNTALKHSRRDGDCTSRSSLQMHGTAHAHACFTGLAGSWYGPAQRTQCNTRGRMGL